MRAAFVTDWEEDSRWLGWKVVGADGFVVARLEASLSMGLNRRMRRYDRACRLAAGLNAGGGRRERVVRELENGREGNP